ncbi:MAG: oligosaccharide flippase family protein, partial [Longicatena sp.]
MSTQTSVSKKTQSIIAGGLISSAGIFFAKFIGLFYAVPYNTLLATADNIAYYGVAYQIYSYLLNICIAGFPFAIATLIAKYSAKGDYQTSLLIKKLSSLLMISFGFIMMSFVIVFATPLAKLVLPDNANNINTMRMVLILISFALFFVPILSSVRGFYQGLKHMEVYALSQVLEQIARIVFLLIASAIAIYACNADNVWALYFGVISTSIAAVLAIIHIKLYDKKQMVEIKKLARNQSVEGN